MNIVLRWPDDMPEQLSRAFLQGMLDRMAVSFHKYGDVSEAVGMNQPSNIRVRLERYEETGNTEWLMDVANFAGIEFDNPAHADAHYRATDSDESPGRVHVSKTVMGTSEIKDARHNLDVRA